jgi:hypothetical protein
VSNLCCAHLRVPTEAEGERRRARGRVESCQCEHKASWADGAMLVRSVLSACSATRGLLCLLTQARAETRPSPSLK